METKRPPLGSLDRPLNILYALSTGEFERYEMQRKTPNASTIYRCLLPFTELQKRGMAEVVVSDHFAYYKGSFPLDINPILRWADIIVFPRIMNVDLTAHLQLMKAVRNYGIVIAFEHDDWYWDLGRSHYSRHRLDKSHLDATLKTVEKADLITAPNAFLIENSVRKAGYKMGQKYHRAAIPNATYLGDWDRHAGERKKSGPIRICMSGASNHYIDWLSMGPVMRELKEKYGNRIKFEIVGFDKKLVTLKQTDKYTPEIWEDIKLLDTLFREVGAHMHPFTDFDKYPQLMNRVGPDIGLIVTSPQIYDECKSSLKFMDYTLSGAATVCSMYRPYTDELDPEVHTLFAKTNKEWVTQISRLIDEKGLRETLKKNARSLVEQDYNIDRTVHLWNDAFRTAYALVNGK